MTLDNNTPMSVQISLQIGDPKYDATCTADPNSSCTAKQQTWIMILLK